MCWSPDEAGRRPRASPPTLASAEGVAADRMGDLAPVLAAHRPDLVIDAAGPFQASDYRVPLACIAARIPYLDLADARAFVTGIGALDEAARAAGVAVIAGASTAPALTGAVARHLARGLDRVDQVESRSAPPAARPPAPRWRGRSCPMSAGRSGSGAAGAGGTGHGWQEMRNERDGRRALTLGRRRVALVDVPDHDLLPAMLPGRPADRLPRGQRARLSDVVPVAGELAGPLGLDQVAVRRRALAAARCSG